jgi:serine/threonine-protein kinase HipA
MTSRFGAHECFVYITLPGQTEFVTAGRFVLEMQRGGPLGRFVYGRSYLDRPDAVPIDPVELKLGKATYRTTAQNGMFGALRDASPDHWGRRVIDKHAVRVRPGEVDYLLFAPDDRAGALGFGLNQEPPAPKRHFNQTLDLQKLQDLADAIIADVEVPQGAEADQVQDLMLVGTSMGGARPKAVVEDDSGLWIAKFNRLDDPWNFARVEHAMLMLARECGIETAESELTRVGNRDVLLVKRFDREKTDDGYVRARMISGLTLLRTDDSPQQRERWSYIAMAEDLRRVSAQPRHDAQELFRRICFNALISNTDDHPRNHALIAWTTDWRLSPAYDLTPDTPISLDRRDLALDCGDYGRYAHADNLLSQSPRFYLERSDAKGVIAAMEDQVRATWHETARRAGVTERDCAKIAGAFVYPGLRLPLGDHE